MLDVPEARVGKNRMHLDLHVAPHLTGGRRWAAVTSRVAELRDAGASVPAVVEGHRVVLADPEGNEFCMV